MPQHELHEGEVLGEDDSLRAARRVEDVGIAGVPEAQIAQGDRVDLQPRPHPDREARRELGVDSDLHAAMVGWPTRWLA